MSGSGETTVISGMAMVTPNGIAGQLAGALSARGVVAGLRAQADPAPPSPNGLADRASAMAADAVAALLEPVSGDCPPSRRALVLGSGSAGIDQSMTLITESLTRSRPFNVSPALVPACVMNYASALCAIRFGLQGPNVTVTAGRATGLAALAYATRLIRLGRADLAVCGAYEDLNDRRGALQALAEADGGYPPPGEGCCVFLLEAGERASRSGRPALAEVVALESGVVTRPADSGAVLTEVVGRALARCGAVGDDIAVVAVSGGEERVLRPLLAAATWIRPADLLGDTLGAAMAFQAGAALLAGQPAAGRLVMAVATDRDGQAGCVVLRSGGPLAARAQ